ncbi:MAG: flagellar motor protein MotB [Pseudomonadota bacterium]
MSDKEDELQPIIVKKIKKGGGHHGGAWKVAYADFVTAMMAFFLLLWLLNVTTSEQKAGIADYFDPNPKITDGKSGAGGLLGGLTASPEGAMTSDTAPVVPMQSQNQVNPALRPGKTPGQSENQRKAEVMKEQMRASEERKFREAKRAIEEAVQGNPELEKLAKNIMVESTPEGLRIQVLDQDGESMFARGSAQMYEKTKALMGQIALIIKDMPNEISIRGHTDGVPYGPGATYTNWELSADRANSTRRVLIEAGIAEDRLNNVVGKADREHLVPENPADAKNRRMSIVLIREEITNPEVYDYIDERFADENETLEEDVPYFEEDIQPVTPEEPLYEPTPGEVEFP